MCFYFELRNEDKKNFLHLNKTFFWLQVFKEELKTSDYSNFVSNGTFQYFDERYLYLLKKRKIA